MHTSSTRLVARALLRALPLAFLLLGVACDGASPRTIGGYCRRDSDCVDGLRCLDFQCTERRTADAGAPPDLGGADLGGVDLGATDLGAPDLGPRDMGSTPTDTGVDVGPTDTGVDVGPADTGVDSGPEDMGTDSGPDAG